MDKIQKALQKLSEKERLWVKEIIEQIISGNSYGLNIKKLKDKDDFFRVRRGDIRIIYRLDRNNQVIIISIDRRNEDTYKF